MKFYYNFFLETNKVLLNCSDKDIESKDIFFLLYYLYKTINVEKYSKDNYEISTNNNTKLILIKKSINIIESKVSIPLKIENFNLDNENNEKKKYKKSIRFVLFV